MRENKKYFVLVVDDERLLCDLLAEQIESELIHCDKAYSGEDALERLKSRKYNILITDIKMSGMSGLDLIKKMNEEVELPPPAYVTSGFSNHSKADMVEAGAKDFFKKPESIEALINTIQGVCR